MHSAITLAMAYVLGPLGLMLTNRGRRSGLWTACAAGTAVLIVVLAAAWWAVAARGATVTLLPLLTAGTMVCILAAYSVWAHSLRLLLTSHRFPGRPWPNWLRNPWVAGLLSLPAPGVAWVFTRWPRRSVVTVWATWPLAVAVALLLQAPLVWRHREIFAGYGLGADALERIFFAAGVLAVAAPLVWLAQALAGARATAALTERWRARRGDWAAVALVVTIAMVGVAARPGDLARDLGDGASVLRADGFRLLPLHLNQLARHLDPGQPIYALQMVELHAERGDAVAAAVVRLELDEDMQPYLGALLREGTIRRQENAAGRMVVAGAATMPGRNRGPARRPSGAGGDASGQAALTAASLFIPGLPLDLETLGPPEPDQRAAPSAEPAVASPAAQIPAAAVPEGVGDPPPATALETTPR